MILFALGFVEIGTLVIPLNKIIKLYCIIKNHSCISHLAISVVPLQVWVMWLVLNFPVICYTVIDILPYPFTPSTPPHPPLNHAHLQKPHHTTFHLLNLMLLNFKINIPAQHLLNPLTNNRNRPQTTNLNIFRYIKNHRPQPIICNQPFLLLHHRTIQTVNTLINTLHLRYKLLILILKPFHYHILKLT